MGRDIAMGGKDQKLFFGGEPWLGVAGLGGQGSH